MKILIAVLFALLVSVPAVAGPLAWLGGGYSHHTLGHEVGGEVWFPKAGGNDGALFVGVVGGFNFDGTAKIGGTAGLFSDDFIALDVKGYGLASTTAGGREGWGVGPGFSFFLHGRRQPVLGLRVRVGYDWGHVAGVRRSGPTILVQVGPFGR